MDTKDTHTPPSRKLIPKVGLFYSILWSPQALWPPPTEIPESSNNTYYTTDHLQDSPIACPACSCSIGAKDDRRLGQGTAETFVALLRPKGLEWPVAQRRQSWELPGSTRVSRKPFVMPPSNPIRAPGHPGHSCSGKGVWDKAEQLQSSLTRVHFWGQGGVAGSENEIDQESTQLPPKTSQKGNQTSSH